MEPISLRHRKLRAPILRLQSDERLARLAGGGDEDAFELLVRRHRPAVLRACRRILGPAAAEDAAQRALLAAHQALLRNEPPDRFEPWLQRVAINEALKELRGKTEHLPLDEERHDGVEQPAERLERRERLRSTVAAIGALPEGQRRALVLRELEGRSHDEIAGALGLSKGAVRQLIHRARSSLRSTATALTPYGLLGRLDATSDGSTRAAEAVAGGGAAAFAGKTLVAAILAGGIASGISMVPEDSVPTGEASGRPGKQAAASGGGEGPTGGDRADGIPGGDERDHRRHKQTGGDEGPGGSSGPGSAHDESEQEHDDEFEDDGEHEDEEEAEGDGEGGSSGPSGSSSGSGSSGSEDDSEPGESDEDEPKDDD